MCFPLNFPKLFLQLLYRTPANGCFNNVSRIQLKMSKICKSQSYKNKKLLLRYLENLTLNLLLDWNFK